MRKNIISTIFILPILIIISCDYCDDFRKASKRYFLDKKFDGIIDSVYIDNSIGARASPYIKVKYSRYNILGYGKENFSKGDSIVKKEGTLELLLYKDGFEEPIILKPKCKGREFE